MLMQLSGTAGPCLPSPGMGRYSWSHHTCLWVCEKVFLSACCLFEGTLESFSPWICMPALSYHWPLLKCHLLWEAFSDHPI